MTPTLTKISLVSPFPPHLAMIFRHWLNQYPERSMDDDWESTFGDLDAVEKELRRRAEQEQTYLVKVEDCHVGFIGYQRINQHLGSMRAVVFDRSVHGDGTALRAMRYVLQKQFDSGVHKILAFPFSDNGRAKAFYRKLGGVEEGVLRDHTIRGGKMVDMTLMAFFAKHDGYKIHAD